jgi:hypothetical protein
MGAWGSGAFENDGAMDFVQEVTDGSGLKRIESALAAVLKSKSEYLEAPEAEEGLAASAMLAEILNPAAEQELVPLEVSAWASNADKPLAEIVEKARQVVLRVLTPPSELLELWTESEDFENWKSGVEAIGARL